MSSTTSNQPRTGIAGFLLRRQGRKKASTADLITYLYLVLGTVIMFGPVVWLVMSSFKPIEGLYDFPPTFLPLRRETAVVPGYDKPLELYDVTFEDGSKETVEFSGDRPWQRFTWTKPSRAVSAQLDPGQSVSVTVQTLDTMSIASCGTTYVNEASVTGVNNVTYDPGSYLESLNLCEETLRREGWFDLRDRESTRHIGIGFSCFNERTGYGSAAFAAYMFS